MQLVSTLFFSVISLFGIVLCQQPRDCQDVYEQGFNTTGKYIIFPEHTEGFQVRCDMNTTSGGWTVIQRRVSDSNFYRYWNEYQIGFGDLNTNFWLGLLQIHALTSQSWYELRIDMTHANGTHAYAAYKAFAVGDTESKYRLLATGYYGDAGDSLKTSHNGHEFSTRDRDNDIYGGNCASRYIGAWWYGRCHMSNLNGDYGNNAYARGLTWRTFTGYYSSLTFVEMKVKRLAPDYSGVGNPPANSFNPTE